MADTAITLNDDRVSTLSNQERAVTGFSHKFTIPYSDLTASTTGATDTVTVTMGALPAKWYIDKALLNITTAFAGITAMTVKVGTTTSAAALVSSNSVLTVATIPMESTVPILTNATATATKNLVTTFTAAGTGGPAGLTAGSLSVYLNIQDTAKLP